MISQWSRQLGHLRFVNHKRLLRAERSRSRSVSAGDSPAGRLPFDSAQGALVECPNCSDYCHKTSIALLDRHASRSLIQLGLGKVAHLGVVVVGGAIADKLPGLGQVVIMLDHCF